MKGVFLMKKASGTPLERSALDDTMIDPNSGTLTIAYSSSDLPVRYLLTSFISLLVLPPRGGNT
jgi:hypothetical protein